MNNKSIVGALLILASAVLFSASLICSSLSAVVTATLGFIATSKPSSITILIYVISALLAATGLILILLDFKAKH